MMSVVQTQKLKIRIYVDALNFYYGIAKPYGFKWVDIKGLFCELLQPIAPNLEIEKIFLFTAMVQGAAANRQKIYVNALQAHYGDGLEVVTGYMTRTQKKGKILGANTNEIVTVQVYEEKETDVNIACQIVEDAYTCQEFDISCLVSNDSDIARALMIKKRLKQRVLLICPRTKNSKTSVSNSLKRWVNKKDRIVFIDQNQLIKYRLPDPIGKWHSPKMSGWR